MIQEAITLGENVRSGKVSAETYMMRMAGMIQTGKMMDRHINFLKTEKALKISLSNVGPELVGYNPEIERVKCPAIKKPIERRECLDFSGEKKFEECICEVGAQTRTLLLPEEK